MPWTFADNGAAVTVASGNVAFTEFASAAANDLFLAVIAYRGSVGFTLPSGWTLIQQQTSGNTTANATTSIASILMAYIIRGSSTPALTFTRTGGDAAIGRILVYRGVDTANPLVTSSSTTLATAATAISVSGVTTVNNRDLIVAGIAGGRQQSFTAFNTATNPNTSSGTNSGQTADPIEGTWQERADSNTGLGADTTLAIGDALRATAGATGNFTATGSLSARHAVAIAVFKEASAGGGTVLDLAGTSAGTSTTSGNATIAQNLAGASAGTSTTTGNATVAQNLAGNSAGSSTTVGNATVALNLAGTSAGTSTTTGAIASVQNLAGVSAGSSTTTGSTTLTANLSGTSAGSSATIGNATVIANLSGLSAGISSDSGNATTGIVLDLEGTSAGSSTTIGSASLLVSLTGLSAGSSTTLGDVSAIASLSGSSAGTSTTQGAATVLLNLSGVSAGTSSDLGSLDILTNVETVIYSGLVSPVQPLVGTVTIDLELSGSVDAVDVLSGSVT